MTEEIIIDGVNVAGCQYYNGVVGNVCGYCNIDEEHLYTCESDENCYYKQLKRLEQENEILKKKLDLAVGRSITNCEAAQKYWAVLEEIKEIAEKELYLKQNSSLTKILDKINEVSNLS